MRFIGGKLAGTISRALPVKFNVEHQIGLVWAVGVAVNVLEALKRAQGLGRGRNGAGAFALLHKPSGTKEREKNDSREHEYFSLSLSCECACALAKIRLLPGSPGTGGLARAWRGTRTRAEPAR